MPDNPAQPAMTVAPETSIRDAIETMTELRTGILAVVGGDGTLFGVVVDGDVRRAIIGRVDLDGPVSKIATREPVIADAGTPHDELVKLMLATRKQALPLIGGDGRFQRLVYLDDMLTPETTDSLAVILAGGFGKRLAPYTDRVPKPMLRVGSKPVIEKIIEGLVEEGVNDIVALLHYRPEAFIEHFRERKFRGKAVEFLIEDEPRGTAGGLALLRERLSLPFLVLNGDNLVRADWLDVIESHKAEGNVISIGATIHTMMVPYGVLVTDGAIVTGVVEKPSHEFLTVCSAYCLSPEALDYIPKDGPFDMPDLIAAVLADGHRVSYFHVREVHRIEDLAPYHQPLWED